MSKMITWRGGVVVSNNKASGLSARTEDFVHKQLNPQRHEYKLSKLSGIHVHPFTKTLTWSIFSSRHSSSKSWKEEDPFDWIGSSPLCFSLNRGQPTWESHFRKALIKSVNGSGPDLVSNEPASEMGWKELDTDGNSRIPEKKITKKAKPNMAATVNALRGFNGIVRRWSRTFGTLFLSILQRDREQKARQSEGLTQENRKMVTAGDLTHSSEIFLFLSHSPSHWWIRGVKRLQWLAGAVD